MRTSIEVSIETGRAHKNVLRTIRSVNGVVDDLYFSKSFYTSSQNKMMPMYEMCDAAYDFIIAKCSGLNRENRIRQNAALDAIEQVLGIKLTREYRVGPYRIDGYDKESNTAYEIDEQQHFNSCGLSDSCKQRQAEIVRATGCTFNRIKV